MANLFNIPVFYINLDKRPDRRRHVENVLLDFKNIERIPAIDTSKTNGYEGCVLSHITALEKAKKKKLPEVIIMEDDFEWVNKDKFVYPEIDFDVCLLESVNACPKKNQKFISWNYNKVVKSQHTGCYLIKEHFYDKLINNFKESYELLKVENTRKHYLDIYWFKLQMLYTFIAPSIQIGRQMEDYSNIRNKVMKRY